MTNEDSNAIVANAIEKHISVDPSVRDAGDKSYEAQNAAKAIARDLSRAGIRLPDVEL
jgi:hypothetical protein